MISFVRCREIGSRGYRFDSFYFLAGYHIGTLAVNDENALFYFQMGQLELAFPRRLIRHHWVLLLTGQPHRKTNQFRESIH